MLSGRPQTNKVRPWKPLGFVTYSTKKPSTSHNWFKEPSSTSSTTSQKQLLIAKPWTNKPPSFVTSSDSSLKPSFPEMKFPSDSDSYEVTQSLLIVPINSSPGKNRTSTVSAAPAVAAVTTSSPSSLSSTYDLIATSKPSSIAVNST